MRDRAHSEAMAELCQADPAYAATLVAEVRRDGDLNELAILVSQLATTGDLEKEGRDRST